jgi:hypothetical protein
MKGINSTGAPLVHVPGWMDGWMDGWVGGCKSRFKDCLQQSTTDALANSAVLPLTVFIVMFFVTLKSKKICWQLYKKKLFVFP